MPALALLLGTWLQLRQPRLWPPAAYAGVLLAAIAVVAWAWVQRARGRAGRCRLGACGAALLLGFALTGWRAVPRLADRLAPGLSGRVVVLEGRIEGLAETSGASARFVFRTRDPPPGVPRRIQVAWHGGQVHSGQGWRLPLRLRPVHGLAGPGVGDSEWRMFERGIGASATVAGPAKALGGPARGGIGALRERLRRRIDRALDGDPQAGVVRALAIGDQSAIPAAQWRVLRATGVAHLVAISGLHVAMLAGLAARLAAMLWRGRWALLVPAPRVLAWVRLAAATVYAALSGMGVPAQRAVLMLVVVTVLRGQGRRAGRGAALTWALGAVLLWDPWALLAPGFWLSFCAVAALVAAEPGAGPPASRLGAAARAQAAVSLALAPLTLALFQQIAVVGPLANAVAIPVVTLWVAPAAIAGLLLPAPLDAWAWRSAAWVQQGLDHGLSMLAALPLAQWHAPAPAGPALALAAVGTVALIVPWPWRLRAGGVVLLLPLLLAPGNRPPPGRLEAWIADVGQGGAVLLRTAHHDLLFDTGPPWGADADAGQGVLLPLLHSLGDRRVDLVVLSHGDADHVGGAASVAGAFPGTPELGSVETARALAWGFAAAKPCQAGQHWVWDGVEFSMLHPEHLGLRGNAASCVLRARSRHGTVLLPGDIARADERRLLASGADLRADLLLAPHHGSGGSSSEPFIRAVAPAAIAVQVGFLNRYGHPAAEARRRWGGVGAAVWRTDRDGALHWRDDDPRVLESWRAQRPRYWSWRAPAPASGAGPDGRAAAPMEARPDVGHPARDAAGDG